MELCASGCSPVKRPRLYWCTWPLMATPEFRWEAHPGATGVSPLVKAQLQGPWPARANQLERGSSRPAGVKCRWATFMRAIPRVGPPPKPFGLSTTPAEAEARWRADKYRYPPYQYKSENSVVRESGLLTTLNSRERRVKLGFPWLHCQSGINKKLGLSKTEAEDIQCSLCGN